MTRLVVSADAKADVDAIIGYLEREAGSHTAAAYAARFTATIERLLQFPRSGAPRPALGAKTRIAIVLPYVLIYDFEVDEDTLYLLRILHGKQDITERLIAQARGD